VAKSRSTSSRAAGDSARPASQAGPSKKLRRDQARRDRAALLRKAQRRRRLTRIGLRVGAIVLASALVFGWIQLHRPESPKTGAAYAAVGSSVDPATLPGIDKGALPWAPELDHVRDRLNAIGLQPLPQEGTRLHIHQHLDLYVNGQKVTVPAGIGIQTTPPAFFSPIHTHDTSGIIHVESPTVRDFTLGEFFDVWGVRFTSTCIGSYCTQGNDALKVFVDGLPVTRNPRQVKLTSHEEIVVAYGTPQQLRSPIPSSYTFPAGY